MPSGFHGGSRSLQERFDTQALADRIDALLVSDTISEGDRAFIECRDMFFLATADAEGWPTCSYKGGDPGFVRVVDPHTVVFPPRRQRECTCPPSPREGEDARVGPVAQAVRFTEAEAWRRSLVVVDRYGEPIPGVGRRHSPRDGPRAQHAGFFQAQVEEMPRPIVLMEDEHRSVGLRAG